MDDYLVKFVVKLKSKARDLEIDISHAKHENLYDLGRLQGRLDGIEECTNFFELAIADMLEDDED